MATRNLLLTVALLSLANAAPAAHPLLVDDSGVLEAGHRELEIRSRVFDSDPGDRGGLGLAGRIGLGRDLDSGLGLGWARSDGGSDMQEFVADLKWAPGRGAGWRPRPFLRPDFALLVGPGQAPVWAAGMGAGLTWDGRRGMFATEVAWARPLESDFDPSAAWILGTGADVPVAGSWRFALEWRRYGFGAETHEIARGGAVREFGPGDLSLGLQWGTADGDSDRIGVVLGWTALFE